MAPEKKKALHKSIKNALEEAVQQHEADLKYISWFSMLSEHHLEVERALRGEASRELVEA